MSIVCTACSTPKVGRRDSTGVGRAPVDPSAPFNSRATPLASSTRLLAALNSRLRGLRQLARLQSTTGGLMAIPEGARRARTYQQAASEDR